MKEIFYNDENGNTKVEVLLENEGVWLNTEALSTLFNVDRSGIVRHINNIYKDEELNKNRHMQKLRMWVMMENKLIIQNIIILIWLFPLDLELIPKRQLNLELGLIK